MNKFLEAFCTYEERTGRDSEDEFKRESGPVLDCEEVKGARIDIVKGGFSITHEYFIYGRVGVKFSANDVQLYRARNNALRQLNCELYRDFIPLIYEAKNAAYSGSRSEVMNILDSMMASITGKDVAS